MAGGAVKALVIGSQGYVGGLVLGGLIRARHDAAGYGRGDFDVLDPHPLPEADVVYLCAAQLRLHPHRAEPLEWRTNVDATLAVIAQATRAGAFVVYPSSTAVETRADRYAAMKAHVEAALWGVQRVAVVRLDDVRTDPRAAIAALVKAGETRAAGLTRWPQ